MALIRGSRGLIYFVHEWKPKFNEHALLDDPVTLKAVTAINKQIAELAPVLNGPTIADAATVVSANKDVPVATMVKRHADATYLFAVSLRAGETKATFTLKNLPATAKVEVLAEERELPVKDGAFEDGFNGYGVHLYRIK